MRISDWSSDVCSSYLHGGVGLLKTEITEYSGSGLEGNELPRSPAFTGSAGVLYRNGDGLTAAIDARYTSSYHTEVTNPAGGEAGPWWSLDARIAYDFGGAEAYLDRKSTRLNSSH